MTHWTLVAALLRAAAETIEGGITTQPTGDSRELAATPSGEEPKRRGRPPGSTNAPKEPAATPSGPTDEERFEKNKALIKPLVDNQQGEDVKKITMKYVAPNTSGIKNILPENQAAFEKDIAALAY